MKKACLSCGTVNNGTAKFCSQCGSSLTAGKSSSSSPPKSSSQPTKFCKKCNDSKHVIGTANYWIEKDPILGVGDEQEWVCEVLECKHRIPIKKTGRKRNPLLDL